jgi:hypothetical protein
MFGPEKVSGDVWQDRPISALGNLVWSARSSVIQVEALDHYGVPDDDLMFSLWRRGDEPTAEQLSGYAGWFGQVREAAHRGVQIDRVHVVPETLTPYLRFEIEFAYRRFCQPNGENVWILQREVHPALASRVVQDFYLIDEERVLLPKYNSLNNFVGLQETGESSTVELHRALREDLLKSALPLEQFYSAMKSSPLTVRL